MKKYEFKVLTAGYDHEAERRIEDGPELEAYLNRLGAQGWDYKSTVIIKSDSLLVFKRECK